VNKEHHETQYRIEPLGDKHDRAAFSCGVEALDRYLQRQASQDVSRRVAAAFVITADGTTIAGFYTLSAHLVNLTDLPESVAKRLPRYLNVPATLLGRLAVSENFRGQGIGELLLLDALKRALGNTREVASAVVVVDAKDERARGFYSDHDFIPLPTQPNRLFYPMKTIEKLFLRKPEGTKRDHAL
jgi:ribosomal protein S18 acetylase RimI-like enzyme